MNIMSTCRIEMTFNGKTVVYSGILREVSMNSDYAPVTTYDGASFPTRTDMRMTLELMGVQEECEYDEPPDEQ